MRKLACIVFLLLLLAPTLAPAEPQFPALSGRVVDGAGILDSSTRTRLEAKLEGLESKTGTQLVVATLRSLQGLDIADYGYQLGRRSGIGEKGRNNGAVLIVAPNERKVRIEVGYGLEATLTDAISRLIIENAILPRFRTGDFTGGIERGVDDLVQVLSGDAEDFRARAAERKAAPSGSDGLMTFAFIAFILFVWFIGFVRQSRTRSIGRRGSRGPWLIPTGFPSGGGGGWSSGNDSGGGFSGGGGSFGGGGASGSW